MLRMIEYLSACFASSGSNSQICMPSTFVGIGDRSGPQKSVPASGLGSKVSRWHGPPHIQIWITDFAFRTGHIGNVANFTAGNNAVGLYVNHSRTIMTGFEVNGAKIGVHVQNSLFSNEIRPVLAYGSVLTGPGRYCSGAA